MAQNNIADKVLNIGIVIAVVFGLWYLFKFFKGEGKGTFGPSPTPGEGEHLASGGVMKRISDAVEKKIIEPTTADRFALELATANESAKKYLNHAGSNIIINKTLKAVNRLNDADYIASVNKWLKLMGEKDFYNTALVGAEIYTASHSDFLSRYGNLTGKTSFANSADLHLTNGMAVNAGQALGSSVAAAMNMFNIGGAAK